VLSGASCVLCGKNGSGARGDKTLITVDSPGEAFVAVLGHFRGDEFGPRVGVASGAVLEEGVCLGKNVALGANCFVGRGAVIGDGCVLWPNVVVGPNTTIGASTRIYPNVTIYSGCKIGSGVVLHSGVVIGADGFGYRFCGNAGLVKFPHIGTVEIGDDVEIGANSTVDRAKTGATVIGSGTKIDNLVHIAHNVKIGRGCVIVALSGVAGSARIGDNVTCAAQSGIKDHVVLGDRVTVAARAGVTGDVPDGLTVSGYPAREHRFERRVEATRLHLPEIMQRLRLLERQVSDMLSQAVGKQVSSLADEASSDESSDE